MMLPSGPELLIIVFIILLLFGAKRLPELASGLGKGIREFKKATHSDPEPEEKNSKSSETKPEEQE